MKVLQGIFLILLTAVLSVTALFSASAFKWAGELPDLREIDAYEFTATSQIFSRNGELIGEIVPLGGDGAPTDRLPVSLDEVSPAALLAVVAYEDDQFFNHYGFDIQGIVRAFYEEFVGSGDRGGSTITTQVIKNTILSDIRDEDSIERKAKELMLAIELERRLTKPEILRNYINVVFWGGNIYGIRAAAEAYFGKDPIELTLAEGLYLARLIPAPNARHADFVATRKSMRTVLDKMIEQGMVSREAAERAWRQPLVPTGWDVSYDGEGNIVGTPERTSERLVLQTSVSSDLAEHVTWAVRDELQSMEQFSGRLFSSGNLKIYTTIDAHMQDSANKAALNPESLPSKTQLALVAIDPQTGEILAMVGERLREGQATSELNRVLHAKRQPGSSFKPIVYATAVEQGTITQGTVIVDEPASFALPGQPAWVPKNWDEKFMGAATAREMLNQSRNIPAVKVLEAATINEVVERAKELGYGSIPPFYSIGLGSIEVTPLEHASAYGAFANQGVHVEPHLIRRVEDAEGNVLYEARPRKERVWSEQTAYVMLDLLRGVVMDRDPYALGWRAEIDGRWVGGKTGTTNDDRDLWFVGVTPGLVAAVWVGNDDDTPIEKDDPADERITSSRQPIYIWKDFVEQALSGTPTGAAFEEPEGIVYKAINRQNGYQSEEGTRMAFIAGTEGRAGGLTSYSRVSITLPVHKETGERATRDTPRDQIEWRQISPSELSRFRIDTSEAPVPDQNLQPSFGN